MQSLMIYSNMQSLMKYQFAISNDIIKYAITNDILLCMQSISVSYLYTINVEIINMQLLMIWSNMQSLIKY